MIDKSVVTKEESGVVPPESPACPKPRRILVLFAVALLSIFVHGYHMGTDDAAIYAPGIEKAADPSLFPFGSEFFMHHAGLSLFPH